MPTSDSNFIMIYLSKRFAIKSQKTAIIHRFSTLAIQLVTARCEEVAMHPLKTMFKIILTHVEIETNQPMFIQYCETIFSNSVEFLINYPDRVEFPTKYPDIVELETI
jgi:hypothetical protein